MLKMWLFLFFISFEAVIIHLGLFPKTEILSLTSLIIVFQALMFYGLLLTLNRRFVALAFIIIAIVTEGLIAYHRYYEAPINFGAITGQSQEALTFALKSPLSLFNGLSLLVLILLVIKLVYVLKFYHPFSQKTLIRTIVVVPLLCFMFLSYNFSHKQEFFITDFHRYVYQFGYPQGWWYEFITRWDKLQLEKNVIANSKLPDVDLSKNLQNIKASNHVFIIQVESLDYAAVEAKVEDREVMPFLKSLSAKGQFYRLAPHDKKSSANSDFSVLTGTSGYKDSYSTIYQLLPTSIYEQVQTLPKMMKEKGYQASFYHGFKGWFFNREKHIAAMSFDQVYFDENLPAFAPRGEWGYDDKDLFSYVLQSQSKGKNFNFIITVSSHENFKIAESYNHLFVKPNSMGERYLNAMNYVDNALRMLITQAPDDALFIIYSDHHSGITADKHTVFIIYDKRLSQGQSEDFDFIQIPQLIKTLLKSFN